MPVKLFSSLVSDEECSKPAEALALECQKKLQSQVINEEINLGTKQKLPEIETFDNMFDALLWITQDKDNTLSHPFFNSQFNLDSDSSKYSHTNVLVSGCPYLVGFVMRALNFKFADYE